MRALVRDRGRVQWCEMPEPHVGPADVAISVRLVGLCRTDLAVASGQLAVQEPRVLGHEFVGRVMATGTAVTGIPLHSKVAANPVVSCGGCQRCLRFGRDTCSQQTFLGVDRDGAIAETIVLPAHNVWTLPESFDDRLAVFLEPIAACAAVCSAPITASQYGYIYGNDRLAMLTERILRARGFEHLDRGTEARSDCYGFAIDTCGTSEVLDDLLRSIQPGGQLILKSRPLQPIALDVRRWLSKQPSIHLVNYACFAEARRLLTASDLGLAELFGPVWASDQHEQAFQAARCDQHTKHFLAVPVPEFVAATPRQQSTVGVQATAGQASS